MKIKKRFVYFVGLNNNFVRFHDREWKRVAKCADCSDGDFCHGGSMHLNNKNFNGSCVL